MTSIVAPQPGSGQLAARVTNAQGLPVTSLPVEAVGPTAGTKTTNTAGCAVFGAVDSGAYQIRLNATGWVDQEGNQLVVKDTTVEGGSLTLVDLVYDRAATLTVNIHTKVRSGRHHGRQLVRRDGGSHRHADRDTAVP